MAARFILGCALGLSAPPLAACASPVAMSGAASASAACTVTGKTTALGKDRICALFTEAFADIRAAMPEGATLRLAATGDTAASAALVDASGAVLLTLDFSIVDHTMDTNAWRIFARDFAAEWQRTLANRGEPTS